jgi:hypothetical protein
VPGHESPGAAVKAEIADVTANHIQAACTVFEPSVQQKCKRDTAGLTSTGASYKNVALGYIVVDGDRGLVGITGTYCNTHEHPSCASNNDPAAILSSGKPFGTLYSESVAASNSPGVTYSLAPVVKVGLNWYVYQPAGDV